MDEDATWYGSRPRPMQRVPALREMGTAPPSFSAHVYCGHGRPSQLLLGCLLVLPALPVGLGSEERTVTLPIKNSNFFIL